MSEAPKAQSSPRAGGGEPVADLPIGFEVGHWSDAEGRTGCTAILAPPGTRGGVSVMGGGPGTRETDVIRPLAATREVTAVVLSGGSAFGLAAADGAMRWLSERGRGYPTVAGRVPIVPAAVIFDLAEGDPAARPGSDAGYAACAAATPRAPECGRVGAGSGAAAGKLLGREKAAAAGVGFAAAVSGGGHSVAALVVANPFGDVVDVDGSLLASPREPDGRRVRTAELLAASEGFPAAAEAEDANTTLACVMTDAPLDQAGCSATARMAGAGIARAVDPVYSEVDGDTVFCLASGEAALPDRATLISVGTLAATLVAAAIRGAVRAASA